MSASYIQIPTDGTGKKVRTNQRTIGSDTVQEHYFIQTDGTNDVPVLSSGGQVGTQVMIVGDGDKYCVGNSADAATDSGNPLKIGVIGRQTNRTAVSDGQRVNLTGDDLGRLVTVPHQVRDLVSDQLTTITSSTSVTTIVTADASNMLDLVSLVLANTSATGSEVQLYNDDGTTLRMTFYVPANDTRGIVWSVPFKQTATNKAWKLKTVTSIASLVAMAQFVKNV